MRRIRLTYPLLFAWMGTLFFTSASYSQINSLSQQEGHSIAVEYLNPTFEIFSNVTYSTASSVLFLSGRYRLTDRLALRGEVPLAYSKADFRPVVFDVSSNDPDDKTFNETLVGNPYIGLQYYRNRAAMEMGFRIPYNPENKRFIPQFARLSDIDRVEAFANNAFPLTGRLQVPVRITPNFFLQLSGGTSIWISTDENTNSEMLLDYTGKFGFEDEYLRVFTGVTGRYQTGDPERGRGGGASAADVDSRAPTRSHAWRARQRRRPPGHRLVPILMAPFRPRPAPHRMLPRGQRPNMRPANQLSTSFVPSALWGPNPKTQLQYQYSRRLRLRRCCALATGRAGAILPTTGAPQSRRPSHLPATTPTKGSRNRSTRCSAAGTALAPPPPTNSR
jgi:hypothetical protein